MAALAQKLRLLQIYLKLLIAVFLRMTMLHKKLFSNQFKIEFCVKLAAITMFALIANIAKADQFVGNQNGREVVVHTSPLPVFLHRLVPPNYGRHVTIQEYHAMRRKTQPSDTRVPNSNSPRNVKNRR